jgi:hypothetical protein
MLQICFNTVDTCFYIQTTHQSYISDRLKSCVLNITRDHESSTYIFLLKNFLLKCSLDTIRVEKVYIII